MKVDFSKPILNLDGSPLEMDGKVLTLSSVATNALLMTVQDQPDGKRPDPDEAVKKYALAMDIHNAKGPINLDAEEAVLLKRLIVNIYGPLVVGRAYEMIEGKPARGKRPQAETS
ncbi:hypothetical protein SAMN02982989_3429 [Xaviernesmea oryzae]|uniref:Uncharacterized protein n=1 Tax=Xaviernesmea oryzae TaxID=464029 RepID=A0A1X7G8W6_9HYPH|nr:hypothetical protein [Xaviernesmea oryzae]SMF65992.1 hypothetical protein SAMN02982989_3429 [Xaviernesmea oryzae]